LIIRRPAVLFAGLIVIAVVAFAVALASGSADISLAETMDALLGTAPENTRSLIMDLRLPRALTAFSVGGLLAVAGGGLLAVAGVLMQVLLRNPLAEPYILGSSGGAAVAALLAMIFGFGSIVIDLAAFGGAMAATLLVFSIAHGTGSWTPARLLLTGVVLAAGFSAATTLLLALSPDQNLRGMLFWLMGDLSFAFEPWRTLWLLVDRDSCSTASQRSFARRTSGGHCRHASLGFSLPGLRGRFARNGIVRHNSGRNRLYRPGRAPPRQVGVRQ